MRTLAVAAAFCAVLATASPAMAQAAGQGSRTDLGGTQGQQAFTVHNHFIFWGSFGLDLDILGDVTAGAIGSVRGTSTLIQPATFPDIYVRTPRRRYVGVGYGLFQKGEVFVRYEEANNPAATVIIGQSGTNSNTFAVSFDNYKDKVIDFGIRKYIATPKNSREYFAIVGGMKTVSPININMQVPGGSIPAQLYAQSRVPTLGLEFGVTLEFHKVGIFLESGLHYQKPLTRNDDDLAKYGLEDLNNTGSRLFMPVNVGLLIRF